MKLISFFKNLRQKPKEDLDLETAKKSKNRIKKGFSKEEIASMFI